MSENEPEVTVTQHGDCTNSLWVLILCIVCHTSSLTSVCGSSPAPSLGADYTGSHPGSDSAWPYDLTLNFLICTMGASQSPART